MRIYMITGIEGTTNVNFPFLSYNAILSIVSGNAAK